MDNAVTAALPWFQLLAFVVVPAALTWGVSVLKAHGVNTMYFEAVARAGGVAFTTLAASGRPITDKAALDVAARAGAQYLIDRVPETLASKGVSPPAATQIVGAELGKLLAADPAITIASKP